MGTGIVVLDAKQALERTRMQLTLRTTTMGMLRATSPRTFAATSCTATSVSCDETTCPGRH